MTAPWLLDHAPHAPFMEARTARPPGLMPLGDRPLVTRDADFEAQMAERRRLIAGFPFEVMALRAEAAPAARELLAAVAAAVPDRGLDPDAAQPLTTLGRATAEDWCLMLPDGQGSYRLMGAVLCFPSRWSLTEKMGRGLPAIHAPVPDYDERLAARVDRVFAGIRAGAPLWRVNWLVHSTPELHLPLTGVEKAGARTGPTDRLYLRTERQTLTRLPRTGAVAFGIKTSLCPLEALTVDEAAGLRRALSGLDAAVIAYRAGADLHAAALARLDALAGEGA